jgi:hypothetical protein
MMGKYKSSRIDVRVALMTSEIVKDALKRVLLEAKISAFMSDDGWVPV